MVEFLAGVIIGGWVGMITVMGWNKFKHDSPAYRNALRYATWRMLLDAGRSPEDAAAITADIYGAQE